MNAIHPTSLRNLRTHTPRRLVVLCLSLGALLLGDLPPAQAADANPAYCGPVAVKASRRSMAEKFAEANVTHDGKLTQAQAQAVKSIAKHFGEIDTTRRGYITYDQLQAWQLARRAERAQAKADAAARALRG